MTTHLIAKELEALKAENARLKAAMSAKIGLKVSEKGAVSLYGLGRFPVTLYQSQWESLLDKAETIKAFIAENKDRLASKN